MCDLFANEHLRQSQSAKTPASLVMNGKSVEARTTSTSDATNIDDANNSHKVGEHVLEAKPDSHSTHKVPAASATPVVVEVPEATDPAHSTILLAGTRLHAFQIPTPSLLAKSPYFINLQNFNATTSHPTIDLGVHVHPASNPLAGPFSFPELEEFAMALFTRWLHNEHSLHGPHDFSSLQHYLSLYVLALKFEIEALQNTVIDLVRHYYHNESMTAPPFRLEYVYDNTGGDNKMREFLVATASYRVLSKGHAGNNSDDKEASMESGLSDSMKDVLRGGGDIAVDLVAKLIELAHGEMEDPRKGDDCRWHVHSEGPFGTMKCAVWSGFEPYESH